MADVRAMLQSERSSRRVKHPLATYTSSGALSCNLCHSVVKQPKLWDQHLRSEQHNIRLKQTQQSRSAAGATPPPVSKKRKADDDAEHEPKKARSVRFQSPLVEEQEIAPLHSEDDEDDEDESGVDAPQGEDGAHVQSVHGQGGQVTTQDQNVDKDEWDAFEREMAADAEPESEVVMRPPAVPPGPTISAAPLSAEQLAAQAREEQSTQKDDKAEELQQEREEASRETEDEMGRMAELDAKMQELKSRREAIRRTSSSASKPSDSELGENVTSGVVPEAAVHDNESDEDDDDDDEDDVDEWAAFR